LEELYPGGRILLPRVWRDSRYNHPAQPVVGVTWYEAQAYCRWLSEQAGTPMRLPSEVEWETAARGTTDCRYAWGDEFEPFRGNSLDAHVRGPTPAGVFPDGATSTGLLDLSGNTADWTQTAFGSSPLDKDLAYPYNAQDGREDLSTGVFAYRIVRGGGWRDPEPGVRISIRNSDHVTGITEYIGFRLCRG